MVFHSYDLHIHSCFSDGQVDLDNQFELIHENHLQIVGFADHIHPGSGLFSKAKLEYRKGLLRFYEKKYHKYGIRVLIGGEIDILEGGGLTLPAGITPDHFDYLLVSKHHTLPKQIPMIQKRPKVDQWLWKHDPGLKINKIMWFKGIQNCFIHASPDIWAHPLWNMPGNMSDRDFKRVAWLAMKYGVTLELNPNHRSHWSPRQERQLMMETFAKYRHVLRFSLGSDFHGFKKDKISEMGLSQEMYEEAVSYGLLIIDPHLFLPENRSTYKTLREERLKKIAFLNHEK